MANTLLDLDVADDECPYDDNPETQPHDPFQLGGAPTSSGTQFGGMAPESRPSAEAFHKPIDDVMVWDIIASFFRSKGLVHQQVDSFNHFLARIPVMVRGLAEVVPRLDDQHDPARPFDAEREQVRVSMTDVRIGVPTHENDLFSGGRGPPMFPNECRLRDMTYSAHSEVTVLMRAYTDPEKPPTMQRSFSVPLGRIPIMLKSMRCNLAGKDEDELPRLNECPHDQGGYFVINGTEKVLIAQERQAANHIYTYAKSKELFVSEIKSMIEGSMTKPRTLQIKISSSRKGGGFGAIECRVAQMETFIPLFVLYRALDVLGDKEVLRTIVPDIESDLKVLEVLRPSMEVAAAAKIFTQDAALVFIGNRLGEINSRENLVEKARSLLARDLLPHMGTDPASARRKCFFLGIMVHKLLLVALGRREETDRDFLGNKRMDMAGALLGYQFNTFLVQIRNEMGKVLRDHAVGRKPQFKIEQLVNHGLITSGMRSCLSTGNFGGKNDVKTGVAQTLNRLTYSSSLSNLRRIQNPIDPGSKATRPRNLHCTQWGYICPVETPEGGSIGLLKNMALMCLVSIGSSHDDVVQLVEALGVSTFATLSSDMLARVHAAKIFVNGTLIGVHESPQSLLVQLRHRRRAGQLSSEVSIVRDIRDRELRVWSDAGRPIRPLFVVEETKLRVRQGHLQALMGATAGGGPAKLLQWESLVDQGFVEMIDCEEEDSILIAMRREECQRSTNYSHCEMEPSMIFGICASIIPFPNHNQSPRNTYQSAMGKQAMGIYASNFRMRMDTTAHVLCYPQKPLVRTQPMSFMHSNDLPAGHNAIVAISCYSGYNQEDSVVMSKSSVDRGFFRSIFWRSYKATEEEKHGVKETFENPDKSITAGMRNADYSQLDADGLIVPGAPVYGGEILVGKTAPIPKLELLASMAEAAASTGKPGTATKLRQDCSLAARSNEKGIVDSVMLTQNERGYRFTKVKVRTVKIPNIGDKFCSRHGQKGTNGIQLRQEDLPFTRDGIVPDIIINPHAIPSRMTIAHLIETLAGKVACMAGREADATAFGRVVADEFANALHKYQFQRWGNECLYSGHTGLPLEALIYFGPTYYQRLKHLSGDKIHARPRGPLQNLVRQPTHGRAHDGGLRFGEMERDCMLSYGASQWLKERLFRVSDLYAVHVCKKCGTICSADTNQHVYYCAVCDQSDDISRIQIPYACKLLFQELMSMTILPRIGTTPQ